MRKIGLLMLGLIIGHLQLALGQTWTGAVSNDWNTAGNWSPANVPLPTGNVVLPASVPSNRWPALAAATTINNFNTSVGSQLNLQNFALTINGSYDINGTSLSTTTGGTITLNMTGTGANYLRNSTFNGNTTVNLTSSGILYEAFSGLNTYHGNTTFNLGNSSATYVCYTNSSQFNGNLTINRTVAGPSYLLFAGANITGNFSYTNLVGGQTQIGNAVNKSLINGIININYQNSTGTPSFDIYKVKQNTAGGAIQIGGCGPLVMRDDSLRAAVVVDSFATGTTDLQRSSFGAAVALSERSNNTGSIYLRSNVFATSFTLTCNGNGLVYENFGGPNQFNGAATFNFNSTATHYISYSGASSTFLGNLTVNRSKPGPTYIFYSNATMVGGNFSYTNLVGGNTEIGSSTGTSIIQGNSTINYTGQLPNRNLTLQNLKSLGAASNHTIRNAGLVRIIGDTLTGTLVVDSFGTGGVTDFDRINITGTTQLIEGSYQNTITYLRRSRFNGPFTYQANSTSASAILYEAYQGGNTYIQNALFEFTAPATQYIAYENASSFMANLSIVRKGTGRVDVFTSGASTVLGHFSFTNPFGGITNIGNNTATTTIQGKVTIEIQPPTPTGATTSIIRLKNQTAGGIVRIIGGGLTSLQRDTLVVDSIIMRNLGGNGLHDHRNNHLTAHVHMSDAPMSNCSWYWVGSTVNGNAEFIKDGTSNIAYFAYLGNSYFGGHVHHKVNSGTFQLSYDSETYYMGNLLLENNAANSIIFGNHNTVFTGAANTSYEQLGSQLITIPRLRIDKANQARLTLQDSLVIGQQLQFEKGYIYTSPEAELWFANNAVAINARDSSHVVGPVSKTGSQAFSFPVGDGRFIQPIGISAPVLATDRFRAQYFTSTAPQDTAARAGTLAVVSGAQHWTLNQVTGTSNVVVTLEYGRPRGLAITAAQANLRVARWNGSLWADLGQAGATGNHTEGTINTTSATSAFGLFTLAATSTIDPLPNTTTIAAPGCANEARIIPFKTSGRFNPHNTFVAQLSNASGSFANPLTIGAIDLAPDGINQEHSLTAFIPSSALGNGSGSNYRIRVISTDAPHTGSTNPAPLSLNSLYIGPDTLARIACPGGTANLTGLYNLTGLSSSYSPNTPTAAAPGMVRLAVQDALGCKDTAMINVLVEVASWTGATGTDWHTATNWSTGRIPVALTHVIIPNGTPQCIISAQNVMIQSLQVRNGANLRTQNGRTITVNGNCLTLPSP